jgi:hypothetical protein
MRKNMLDVMKSNSRGHGGFPDRRKPTGRDLKALGDEAYPKREGMGSPSRNGVDYTYLVRLLEKNVGKSWQAVLKMIHERVNRRSKMAWEFDEALKNTVFEKVEIIDGVPYAISPYQHRVYDNQFYVDDKGLLRQGMKFKRSRPKPCLGLHIDATHQYHKINEVWWLLTIKPIDVYDWYDVAYQIGPMAPGQPPRERGDLNNFLSNTYGKKYYCVSRRQVSKREIKDMKLKERLEQRLWERAEHDRKNN